jgi:alpha-1,3/alpha-1,6-mannosyltransferase
VYGDWLPRQLFGRFTAFSAILRMLYLALIAALFYRSTTDLIVLDGVSAPIPVLKIFGMKVLFYCHFPDLVGPSTMCEKTASLL